MDQFALVIVERYLLRSNCKVEMTSCASVNLSPCQGCFTVSLGKKKQITFKGSLSVTNCRFWSIHFYFVLWVTVLDWSLRVTFCLNAFYEVLWLPHDHALLKMLGSISLRLCNWITQLLWFFLDRRAAIFPLNDNKKPLNGETIFVWVHLHPLTHASTVKWPCMEISQDHHGRWRFSPYLSVEYLSVSDFRDH